MVVVVMMALVGVSISPSSAFAVPTANAGPDAAVSLGDSYILQGAVELSPLEFWTADGNNATEDMLIKYNELTGISAVGPILSTEPTPRFFGYPSDLQRVGNLVYGIETYHRQFYLLDPNTGAATVIGPRTPQTGIMSLAYDSVNDRMFAVDVPSDKLVRINRATGVTTNVGLIGAIYGNTRALAYDKISGLLYAAHKNSSNQLTTLYTVNPSNMQLSEVMVIPTNAFQLYDELEFHNDELYAVLSLGPFTSCQLQHINLDTLAITNVGPVIPNVSAHSLVIQTAPEDFAWSVVSGPGVVTFDDTGLVDSEVSFSEPGTYVLALTVYAEAGPVIDNVSIEVTSGACQIDTDADGIVDCLDECPNDPLKSVMGQCGCGIEETDTDGDGQADCVDGCPLDAEKSTPGTCGCGIVDTDSDGDGTANCVDGCPNDAGKIESGLCGCGLSDADSDGDGTVDCLDGCPSDPNKTSDGVCGCGISDGDFDGDGALDCLEECPADPGKILPGLCGCGIADTDSDGDQTPDCLDGCPHDPNLIEAGVCGCGVTAVDTDGDDAPDCVDGCPFDALKTEPGMCGCGIQDVDSDGDGTVDCLDGCPNDPLKTVVDLCGCGVPPSCDDGNACTEDSCDPQVGCVNVDISASCDDGLFCNGLETCDPQWGCLAGVDPCDGGACNENTDSCGTAQPRLWMVFGGAPSIPTVGVVEQSDIVSYEPVAGVWALEFDGSDVGLTGQRIDGFARLASGELLVSFDIPLDIPGLIGGPGGATLVDDSDIVMFSPVSLGENTAGNFTFYFDGSDVGLAADNEDVDSISITPDGRLVLSTLGAVIAPGVNGATHDLFVMNATSLGSVTAGTFEMYVKGASVGLSTGTENVVGSTILANGDLLMSTSGPFAVAGLSGTNKDVIRFVPTALGLSAQGTFSMFLQTMPLGIPATARVAELEWVP